MSLWVINYSTLSFDDFILVAAWGAAPEMDSEIPVVAVPLLYFHR